MPAHTRIHYIPIGAIALFTVTLVITYTISIMLDHTEADFPYISDTGTMPPESCIFGQLFDIVAILLGITIYVKYKQVEEFCRVSRDDQAMLRCNKMGFVSGMIATLGLSLVANFQETNVVTVHYTGAFFCFGFGTLYMWMHAMLSYKMHPLVNSLVVAHFRALVSFICTLLFVSTAVCAILARQQFHGKDPHKWYPEDGGWRLHVASTISEWSMALLFHLFLVTFIPDFMKLELHPVQVRLTSMAVSADAESLVVPVEINDGEGAVSDAPPPYEDATSRSKD